MRTKKLIVSAVMAGLQSLGALESQGQYEGLVTRLPTVEQQRTTAEMRSGAIEKAQKEVKAVRSTVAAAAMPITQARQDYEGSPSGSNAVGMVEACIHALKVAEPEMKHLESAAQNGSEQCRSQLKDIGTGKREMTLTLQHAGVRSSDLQNIAANYESIVEQLRNRFESVSKVTPTQEAVIKGALFNGQLGKRAAEHAQWTHGELVAMLQELQESEEEIKARADGFARQAARARAVSSLFSGMLKNFESVLAAWKTTGEVREFAEVSGKLEQYIDETLEGVVEIFGEGSLPSQPARVEEKGRGSETLKRLRSRGSFELGQGGVR